MARLLKRRLSFGQDRACLKGRWLTRGRACRTNVSTLRGRLFDVERGLTAHAVGCCHIVRFAAIGEQRRINREQDRLEQALKNRKAAAIMPSGVETELSAIGLLPADGSENRPSGTHELLCAPLPRAYADLEVGCCPSADHEALLGNSRQASQEKSSAPNRPVCVPVRVRMQTGRTGKALKGSRFRGP